MNVDPSITRTVAWLVVSLVVGVMGGALGGLIILRRRSHADPEAELQRRWRDHG